MRCWEVVCGADELVAEEAAADARSVAIGEGASTRVARVGVTGTGGGTDGVGGLVVGGICVRESGGGVGADGSRVGPVGITGVGVTGTDAIGASGFDPGGGAAGTVVGASGAAFSGSG
jgi:hypothetical protein